MRHSYSNQLKASSSLQVSGFDEAEHSRKNLGIRTQRAEESRSDRFASRQLAISRSSSFVLTVDDASQVCSKNRSPLLRWGYLVPRFILLGFFWGVLALGLDPMLRYGFTRGARVILRTPVGIGDVQTSLFSSSMKMEQIQIADRDNPQKNAVEIDRIAVVLDRNALLRKKFVANQIVVSGINWDGDSTLIVDDQRKRKPDSDWAFPFRLGEKKLAGTAREAGQKFLEVLLDQAVSSYDPGKLDTVRLAKRKDQQWQSRFDLYRKSVSEYKRQIERLKRQIDQSRKGNPLDHINQYAQIAQQADSLIARGKQLKNELLQLGKIARRDVAELNDARIRDYNRLREQIASLPLNSEQLSQTILGPETRRQFAELGRWIQLAQKIANLASQDYKPERTYGRTISFNRSDSLPAFLIREFRLGGVATSNAQPVPFTAELKNITHAPKQLGKPMTYEINITHHGAAELKGLIDLTRDVPTFTLNGKIESYEFPVLNLAEHGNVRLALATGKMQSLINLKMVGDKIDASLAWNQSDVNFLVDGELQLEQRQLSKLGFSPISVVDLLKRSVEGIDGIHGRARIHGMLKSPRVEVRSDVGKIIAKQLQEEFQKEVLLRQDQARQIAQMQIDHQVQNLVGKIDREYQAILTDLKVNENLAENLVEKVAVRPASGVLNRLFR